MGEAAVVASGVMEENEVKIKEKLGSKLEGDTESKLNKQKQRFAFETGTLGLRTRGI